MAINLLPKKEYEFIRREKLQKLFSLISVLALVAFAAFAVLSFSYWLLNFNRAQNLDKETQRIEKEIDSQKQVEGYQFALKEKISALKNIQSGRKDLVPIFDSLKLIIPSGVSLKTVALGLDGAANLAGEAITASDLGSLIDALLDPENGGKYFSSISIDSLSSTKEGLFSFTINAKLKF